jgi:hypothetical protein
MSAYSLAIARASSPNRGPIQGAATARSGVVTPWYHITPKRVAVARRAFLAELV